MSTLPSDNLGATPLTPFRQNPVFLEFGVFHDYKNMSGKMLTHVW